MPMPIKNEHLVWAYGEMEASGDGTRRFVLLVGITDAGVDLLKRKLTLLVNPPTPLRIENVVLFHEKDKDTIKQRFRETGLPITETDLSNI